MFIKFWNFFHGLQIFSSLMLFCNITLYILFIPYVYSRPYVYSFLQTFQALPLFPAVRLFQTLEYNNFDFFNECMPLLKIISPNCDRLALWLSFWNGRPVLSMIPMRSCKSTHTTSVWVTLGFSKYHPNWKYFICFTWQKNMHELGLAGTVLII